VRMAKIKKTEHNVHDIVYVVCLIIAGAGCVMSLAAVVTLPASADMWAELASIEGVFDVLFNMHWR
jgi:hypothetical protein